MEHEDIGVEEYPTNWSEWPVGHAPNTCSPAYFGTEWQDTRWLCWNNIPKRLMNVYLTVYDEIEKHFAGSGLR